MGFSIGSLVSDLTDPGKLVGDLANSVLPSNMKAVGDILGGITDINAGNPLAALSHLTDALKDLPQLLQSLQGAAGGAADGSKPAGTAAAEPTPPPARATTTDAQRHRAGNPKHVDNDPQRSGDDPRAFIDGRVGGAARARRHKRPRTDRHDDEDRQ
jgi:hypothetical protein